MTAVTKGYFVTQCKFGTYDGTDFLWTVLWQKNDSMKNEITVIIEKKPFTFYLIEKWITKWHTEEDLSFGGIYGCIRTSW